MKLARTALMALLTVMTATLLAQTDAPAYKGKFERIKVHGKSLEGNLSQDRRIAMFPFIYLRVTPKEEQTVSRRLPFARFYGFR